MPLRFRIMPVSAAGRAARVAAVASAGLAEGPADERAMEVDAGLSEVRLGRQRGVEFELPFPAVSSLHARLLRGETATEWHIEDLGSMNGTWLDGQRLSPGQPASLRPGQRLRVATVDIVFEGWSASAQAAEGTATIARRLISDLFGAAGDGVPTLTVEFGLTTQTAVRLTQRQRRYLAGRSPSCDLVLAADHASREHAAFVRQGDGVWVSDLGSKNGVQVNGLGISGPCRLSDGDRVSIGAVTLRFMDPEDRYLRRLESLEGRVSADTGGGRAGGDGRGPEGPNSSAFAHGRISTPALLPVSDASVDGGDASTEGSDAPVASPVASPGAAVGWAEAIGPADAAARVDETDKVAPAAVSGSPDAQASAASSRSSFKWLGTSLIVVVALAAVAGLLALWLDAM